MAGTGTLFCTTGQAAELLGVSASWLEKLRVRGDGPPFYRVSARRVLYRLSDLNDWIEAHRAQSTSEYASQNRRNA
jgi:excisionase family DNA binding protein